MVYDAPYGTLRRNDYSVLFFIQIIEKNRSFEMSSFVETVATGQLKEKPVEFVKYPFYKEFQSSRDQHYILCFMFISL